MELLEAQEIFYELLTTNKLKPKIAQKLSILQICIFKNTDVVDLTCFGALTETECLVLMKLDKYAKI